MKYILSSVGLLALVTFLAGCEEKQNKFNRYIQNWTGVNGVIEVYAGEKLVKRFMKIDKLSTAVATEGSQSRSYRYGYGYLDMNQNFKIDLNEKKVYFEVSDFSTYIFFENPTK
ncbi:MAG: hypothetical protein C0625_08545 [Arcobacter sp.]|nr:MAG: hypothetical protein C0625_08545 [Arcobacter sp.]